MKNTINYLQHVFKENKLAIPSVIVGLALIICTLLLTNVFQNFANKSNIITVTGTTEKIVESDTANWTITVGSRNYGPNANASSVASVSRQKDIILKYIKDKGVDTTAITEAGIMTNPICSLNKDGYENCSLGVVGQAVSQSVTVELKDVYKANTLSKDIVSLSGIEMSANTVQYFYNELKNSRKDMLADATRNAKERADVIAAAGGTKVDKIIALSSGVFQVTIKNDISADDYGTYDTSTIEKKITATVKAQFSLK